MFRKDYDWSSEVTTIKAPTMLIFGDTNYIRPEHVLQFFELLGGGKYSGMDGSGASNARSLRFTSDHHHDQLVRVPSKP